MSTANSQPPSPNFPPPPSKRPQVVGLYGISGSGKSYHAKKLQENLKGEQHPFKFYEGSEVISTLLPGGLDAFKQLPEPSKEVLREQAIEKIGKECDESGKLGIVVGHFMLWDKKTNRGSVVATEKDLNTYTHILYLRVDVKLVEEYRRADTERNRGKVAVDDLEKWQREEESRLRDICREKNILFSIVCPNLESEESFLSKLSTLLHDFKNHNENYNQASAKNKLEEIIENRKLDTMLVFDADKTLASQDAGTMFWDKIPTKNGDNPLKTLFSGHLGYSYTAFRQATLLYEEEANEHEFDKLCDEVASEIQIHPEFCTLLRQAATQERVGAIVITCGLRRVWEKVLQKANLSKSVQVIGGGRISDGCVITASVKAALVDYLQYSRNIKAWAFGDSPLDLPMLKAADKAIVVVTDERVRSKTMEIALEQAICFEGLKAYQLLIPSTTAPRLDTFKLPVVRLSISNSIFLQPKIQFLHATHSKTAKILMAPTRNREIAGPDLRDAHRHIGWYLAMEFLGDVIGVEKYQIRDVHNQVSEGHRLLDEEKTIIVPLMRGGEPMAMGINDAFRRCTFVHAKMPEELRPEHLQGQSTIILVDSVINTGKSVVQFIERVRELSGSIRIVVVANVVQAKFVSKENIIKLGYLGEFSLLALRLSDNQFTGIGGTDTGNRLFNTTHLE